MNILFLTPRFPYPPLKGDQTVAYNRIRTLSQKHNIVLLSFYETDDELKGVQHLRDFCREVIVVKLSKWESLLNIGLKFLISPLPLQVLYYSGSHTFQSSLQRIICDYQIDVIHCFLIRLAPYLENINTPKILELIDSMQLNLKRRLDRESFLKSLIFKNEFQRICYYEPNIGEKFSYLIVVAEEDRKYIENPNVQVIYNGVNLDTFKPTPGNRNFKQVIFSGNMGYAPNQEAVLWFAQKCFATIKAKVPDLEFCIVGKDPSLSIQKLSKIDGIKVVGYVPSMAEYIAHAGISIAPMQSGSGMQNKILEAMACGLPVVTTTLGLGSIRAVPEKEIIVCDNPKDFSNSLIELMSNPNRIWEIGKNARRYIEAYHSWEHAADSIDGLYHSAKVTS